MHRHIVFEGIDGSGKDTQLAILAETLRARGRTPIELREPTGGRHGREARARIAAGDLPRIEDQRALFTSDRRDHVARVIGPLRGFVAANEGFVILQNRYYMSAAAYQAVGEDRSELASLIEEQRLFAPAPDVFIVLDVPVEVALRRIRDRGRTDAMERSGRLAGIRRRYQALRTIEDAPQAWIDASAPIADVAARVLEAMMAGGSP